MTEAASGYCEVMRDRRGSVSLPLNELVVWTWFGGAGCSRGEWISRRWSEMRWSQQDGRQYLFVNF